MMRGTVKDFTAGKNGNISNVIAHLLPAALYYRVLTPRPPPLPLGAAKAGRNPSRTKSF